MLLFVMLMVVKLSIMNREQAKIALTNGARLTHPTFINKWVEGVNATQYLFEDGYKCSAEEFWKYRQHENFDKDWLEILNTAENAKYDEILSRSEVQQELREIYKQKYEDKP